MGSIANNLEPHLMASNLFSRNAGCMLTNNLASVRWPNYLARGHMGYLGQAVITDVDCVDDGAACPPGQ